MGYVGYLTHLNKPFIQVCNNLLVSHTVWWMTGRFLENHHYAQCVVVECSTTYHVYCGIGCQASGLSHSYLDHDRHPIPHGLYCYRRHRRSGHPTNQPTNNPFESSELSTNLRTFCAEIVRFSHNNNHYCSPSLPPSETPHWAVSLNSDQSQGLMNCRQTHIQQIANLWPYFIETIRLIILILWQRWVRVLFYCCNSRNGFFLQGGFSSAV